MAENDDVNFSGYAASPDKKKVKLETELKDSEPNPHLSASENCHIIDTNERKSQQTCDSAEIENGVLKDQLPSNISKRQQKRILKQMRWKKWLPLKRAMKRSKEKNKKHEAKLNNIVLGPTRKQLKNSTMAKSNCKLRVALDFSYDHLMNYREIAKGVKQVLHCYSLNRRCQNPLQFYVTNFIGKSKDEMKKNEGYTNWDVNFHEENYLDLFKKEDIIYLTSDSENIITELDHSKVYIIGGLVDHNAHKNESLTKATNQGIGHGQLPLSKFLEMKTRKILTIDHVFEIMLHVTEGMSWKESFLKVLPARKRIQPKVETTET